MKSLAGLESGSGTGGSSLPHPDNPAKAVNRTTEALYIGDHPYL
ncbi:hypothetical protein VCRA2112O187_8210002 [Vibrio crassostreae]|nr:hypothetical protein VCRA2112O187_8210002 [Vibrio crassostreae]